LRNPIDGLRINELQAVFSFSFSTVNRNPDADFLSFDAGAAPVTVYIAYDPAGAPPTSSTHTFIPVVLSEDLTVSDGSVGTFSLVTVTSVTGAETN